MNQTPAVLLRFHLLTARFDRDRGLSGGTLLPRPERVRIDPPRRDHHGTGVIPQKKRAVGCACGKNPLPIGIPRYRVVHGDGIFGYHTGGRDIKSKRLEREQGHSKGNGSKREEA